MVWALQCADALDSYHTLSSHRPDDLRSLALEIRVGEAAGRHQFPLRQAEDQHSVGEHHSGGVCLLDDWATYLRSADVYFFNATVVFSCGCVVADTDCQSFSREPKFFEHISVLFVFNLIQSCCARLIPFEFNQERRFP